MKTRIAGLGILLVLALAGCSRAPATVEGTFADVHGLQANLTDAQLTDRVPLVVVGEVVSRAVVPLQADPFLPPGWVNDDPVFSKALVESGAARINWEVKVLSWTKGVSDTTITVVRVRGTPSA